MKWLISLIIIVLVILYIVSPIDLLPEAALGFLGYIDDLIVAYIGYKTAFR
jgi:uncharacterized membrane protein YkvA (DUF1232 family)